MPLWKLLFDWLIGWLATLLQAAKQRRGIPQYAQPHTLAMGGLQAMEQLLPGFHAEVGWDEVGSKLGLCGVKRGGWWVGSYMPAHWLSCAQRTAAAGPGATTHPHEAPPRPLRCTTLLQLPVPAAGAGCSHPFCCSLALQALPTCLPPPCSR